MNYLFLDIFIILLCLAAGTSEIIAASRRREKETFERTRRNYGR